MGLYRKLYGATLEPLLKKYAKDDGSFHGSFARDLFIEHVAKGRFIVDDQVERLLRELVQEGELEVLHRAPTRSQAAFVGLQYSQSSYDVQAQLTPGTVEHNFFRWVTAK